MGGGEIAPTDNFVRGKGIILPPSPDNPTLQCKNI